MKKLTLDGAGAAFIFHGRMLRQKCNRQRGSG